MQIEKINITDADITSATIDFQVDKTWIDTNKIDKSKITLSRLSNNAWSALPTKQIGETDTYSSYRAESPGLSLFAITGKELPAVAATPPATPAAAPIELPQVVKDYGIWITVFVIAAAVLGYLYLSSRACQKGCQEVPVQLRAITAKSHKIFILFAHSMYWRYLCPTWKLSSSRFILIYL